MSIDFGSVLVEESPDAVIATTPEGQVLYWNKGAQSVFGHTSAEAVGRTLDELVVPQERSGEEGDMRRQALRDGFVTFESVRRHKDGSLVYVDITSKSIRDAEGKVRFVLSSKKDVTHLKVLRDAKLVGARFRELLESMPDGIVIVNATGRIVLANSQAEELFGYARGELRGEPIETLLPARFRTGHVAHRSNYFTQPRRRAMGAMLELYGLRRDGSEFPVEISLSPLETEDGTLVSSAIRDITERKRFEQTLQEKNLELANANQAKDRFLATMSHELRTPLNAIIGFTGTLLMKLPGPLTGDQEKQLRTVQTSGRHLLALINDLLDLAKIEAGKLELQFEPIVCQGVLEEVAASLRPQAEGKGLRLEVAMPVLDAVIASERRALNQIVLNLTSNAIKFTETGHVRLTLAQRAADGRTTTEISVADSGIGILPQDQARLFQAFSQLDSSTRRRHEGSGLGLHLSQKLAGLLGGHIAFESDPGKGSTFTLVLVES